jgi:hypothetical protein
MKIANLNIHRLQLPERAGELQRQGATAALVKELGDNYERYHAFLAEIAQRFDGPPDPARYATREEYLDACVLAQDVVRGEAILRVCRDFRRRGAPLDASVNPGSRLYDNDYRLLAAP